MNRIVRILFLAVALVMGVKTVSAQTVTVVATQKVPVLPSTVTSYMDDPLYFFDVQFIVSGSGGDGVDVFFDMEFSVNTSSFYVRTKPGTIPMEPIHIREGYNHLNRDEVETQLSNRVETNVDYSDLLSLLQLPEGTYELCFDVYRWDERFNPAREPINVGACPTYEICYSGSAPELLPMAGAQMSSDGELVVTPQRKINMFWTPVISNCSTNHSRFIYRLKMVKVFDGQNFQDAIHYNPTVFSAEVRNSTYVVLDTLRDVKVMLERGALYVAQVQAEEIVNTGNTDATFIIANDGLSQPLPFYWGYNDNMNDLFNFASNYKTKMKDENDKEKEGKGMSGLTQWEGGVKTVSGLDAIQEEMKKPLFVGFSPQRRFVESDGYYTIPVTNDLEVNFTPAEHKLLKKVSYSIELYNYKKGGVDSITASEPLIVERVEDNDKAMISRTLADCGGKLEHGGRYYLQMSCFYTVDYWKYTISDTCYYVNDMMAEHYHDTLTRDFVENETVKYTEGVCFQWGDNPKAPALVTSQWTAPVDRSGDDVYAPASYELPGAVPEVKKAKTFPVSWTPVKGVAQGDTVEYTVKVYELKPSQTLEKAVSSNKVLVTRTTGANEISVDDAKFFKVFSAKKTYVMTLGAEVKGENGTHHFKNGNEAIPMVFKIVK